MRLEQNASIVSNSATPGSFLPAPPWNRPLLRPPSGLSRPPPLLLPLLRPLITTAGTPIIFSIIFVVVATSRIIAVVTLRRLWLEPMQPLLRTIYHILDSCAVDTNLEFPVSRVFARNRRLDEARNVECLSFSMAQTYEFVIAAVRDDDGAANSDGLCPRLRKVDTSALLQWT
jgi:hypothetical protein